MEPYRIKTISEYHQVLGMGGPAHPMISVIRLEEFQPPPVNQRISVVFDFYMISLKKNLSGQIKYHYGQQRYDFDEGVLFFIAPGQVFSFEADEQFRSSGWMLLVHPDFLWRSALSKGMRQYEFFRYAVNEALFLSEKEENILQGIVEVIENEYQANIDQFTQKVILSQIETLLNYADRFYHRQFLTRKIANHEILDRLEVLLEQQFSSGELIHTGLPGVQDLSDALHVSPTYLTTLLKTLTGQSAQQHIHNKLIEKAKEKLSTTSLSVSQLAYELGFEHPQSFSKLFKAKTNLSPLEFRASFN